MFKWGTMRFGCLLLALDSITAVKLTNDFILKFWPNVTSSDIDRIAQTNGYINQETGSKITTKMVSLSRHHRTRDEILDPIIRSCKWLPIDRVFQLNHAIVDRRRILAFYTPTAKTAWDALHI